MKRSIYKSPNIDIVDVVIEQGFALSNEQQVPSDWEDM
jgi:hypothetical protein